MLASRAIGSKLTIVITPLQTLRFELTSGLPLASRQWGRLVQARLGHHGISSACIAPLLMLGRSGGGLRQIELAQQLGMQGPSLVRLLDKLLAAGLARRESDANDRRANQLWLTDNGHALYAQLEQDLIELRQHVLSSLSKTELQAALKFHRLLDHAVAQLG